jgi:uncharacterized glyoxalase superfamily protein PhnB
MPTPSNIYPGLIYDDAPAAIEWICRVLGFTQRLLVPGEPGCVIHSELSLGSGVIMINSARPEEGRLSPLSLSATTQSLSVYVEDPDAHFARAQLAGAEILTEPADTNFGARGYMLRDPEGHRWFFSDYRPGEYWDSH